MAPQRERRNEYIAELEEKVRTLERGEGERAVFFQSHAVRTNEENKTLKLENAALKAENDKLSRRVAELEGRLVATANAAANGSVKAGATRSAQHAGLSEDGQSKRPRRDNNRTRAVTFAVPSPEEQQLSPPSSVSASHAASPPTPQNIDLDASLASVKVPACTFCDKDESCFCANMGFNVDHSMTSPSSHADIQRVNGAKPSLAALVSATTTAAKGEQQALDSSAAVPIRLPARRTGSTTTNGKAHAGGKPIWRIDNGELASTSKGQTAVCSGDPQNCAACANDPFGQAFCEALSSTVCDTNPCESCPCKKKHKDKQGHAEPADDARATRVSGSADPISSLPCCGLPHLCGSTSCAPRNSSAPAERDKLPSEEVAMDLDAVPPTHVRADDGSLVPCNEAWAQLKAHPNIGLANLQLLADVVAKRTHCGGPTASRPGTPASVSPAPATPIPAQRRESTPITATQLRTQPSHDTLITSLVPSETLACAQRGLPGMRKRLTVEKEAVRDALAFLDASGNPK